ncbi:MAG: hypothetical protein P8Y63_04130, partial [Deltaproteobacteria bacterium]
MTSNSLRRLIGPGHRPYRKSAGMTILLLLMFLIMTVPATAQQRTLVLPLKINAPTAADKLTRIADQTLQETLQAKGEKMLPRSEAEAVFAYNKTWPPSAEKLLAFTAGKEID